MNTLTQANATPVTHPAAPAAPTKKASTRKASTKKAVKAKGKDKEKNPRSIVPVRFKQKYAEHNDTNGSKLSLALKSATTTENEDGRECLDVDALKTIAKANGIDLSKYAKLNNGQQRMNVGNRLRGMVQQGKTVVIGKQKFADPKATKAAGEPVAKAKVTRKAKAAPAAEASASASA